MIKKDTLKRLPKKTGVYLFRDAGGRVLYVGKAKELRRRISSYFTGPGPARPLAHAMTPRAMDIDYIVTDTEKEALLLESNLIKEHRPRYNIRFKDDKTYVHIRLGLDEEFPRLSVVRRPGKDGSRCFGPYVSTDAARKTIRFLQKAFRMRDCSPSNFSRRARPCIKYQINRCSGPCCGLIGKKAYGKLVRRVALLLSGKTGRLLSDLEDEMKMEAGRLNFERARELRDTIGAIRRTVERQKTVLPDGADRDVVGLFREGKRVEAVILYLRGGALIGHCALPARGICGDDGALLRELLLQHYLDGVFLPPEILLPLRPDDAEALETLLSEERGGKVRLILPRRGAKRELVEMAASNAEAAFRSRRGREADLSEMRRELQKRFCLARPPQRCECVDISNLGGADAVGSLVVFVDAAPLKNDYRLFPIRLAGGADDCGMIFDVVSRRARRGLSEGLLPDLIVVDGGKGQLQAARRALWEAGVRHTDVIAVAKKRGREGGPSMDRVFIPGRKKPIALREGDSVSLFLRRMRDEAHRCAVASHRRRRRRRLRDSELMRIRGIGERRRMLLLRKFGSIGAVASASDEELAEALGSTALAARVGVHFGDIVERGRPGRSMDGERGSGDGKLRIDVQGGIE